MESIVSLIKRLNQTDETTSLEVKRGRAIDYSVMETVCSFSNEPGLGGGHILLGVAEAVGTLFQTYEIVGISDPDKLQRDLASQCAQMFNQPVRPDIAVESVNGKNVLSIWVPELPDGQKPLFFKRDGLPKGAFRRIGSTDQHCTEDDMVAFYGSRESFDGQAVRGSAWGDVDEQAIELYRTLRLRVNASAEELSYSPQDLLRSLGCLTAAGELTYAGLLLFGARAALRRLLPMLRVDYIRVQGTEWVSDPDARFTTTDMRGSLLSLVSRLASAVAEDLPRGFLLPEGQIQAESVGLPGRVLREALVNALMHRSYRLHTQPVQVIRYNNRIEIINPGYSLKPEDQLGEPGSRPRNPFIAAVFHDTNLAETKGSGIRTMRRLMDTAGMVPPTFESNHSADQFTTRLLLHHFLNEEDLRWLRHFQGYDLSDNQKKALIFLREVGAVDNLVFRQLNGCDPYRASAELRALRDGNVLKQQGKGRATYYVPGPVLIARLATPLSVEPVVLSVEPVVLSVEASALSVEPLAPNVEPLPLSVEATLPISLKKRITALGSRSNNREALSGVVLDLCAYQPFTLRELHQILGRSIGYLFTGFVKPLMQQGKLSYTIPDMPNHPDQAYCATKS
ncbi:ATP-binding protein [uncultured Hymenobacter sp.]|uniref:ATP-binding protein n=1 Tax=uncultured Hymenobacter sp. TaxID=170016 RepID=UPI0035CB5D94